MVSFTVNTVAVRMGDSDQLPWNCVVVWSDTPAVNGIQIWHQYILIMMSMSGSQMILQIKTMFPISCLFGQSAMLSKVNGFPFLVTEDDTDVGNQFLQFTICCQLFHMLNWCPFSDCRQYWTIFDWNDIQRRCNLEELCCWSPSDWAISTEGIRRAPLGRQLSLHNCGEARRPGRLRVEVWNLTKSDCL